MSRAIADAPLVPTYRPRRGALGEARASAALAWLAAVCVVAFSTSQPLVLGAALGAMTAAGLMSGCRRELWLALRVGLPLALLVVAVNALVVREGLTVLVRGWYVPVFGDLDITLEALAAGGILALRVLVVVLACAVYSAAVDPDDVLRLFRRVAPRSALTAALATRLAPVLARDARRMAEARRCRPPAAQAPRPGGRVVRLRAQAPVARALFAGALERGVDAAAALEVRGFGSARPTRGLAPPWSLNDMRFTASALCAAVGAVAARAAGVGAYGTYPRLEPLLDPAAGVLAICLAAMLLFPYLAAGLGQLRRARSATALEGAARA